MHIYEYNTLQLYSLLQDITSSGASSCLFQLNMISQVVVCDDDTTAGRQALSDDSCSNTDISKWVKMSIIPMEII